MNAPKEISTTVTAPKFAIRECATQALIDVFDTMLNFKAERAASISVLQGNRVSSSIALVGDPVVGGIYLHMLDSFARKATIAMLGLDANEPCEESTVNDAISELTNMLAGTVKSALGNDGFYCAMSVPSIVRGSAFEIEVPQGSSHEQYGMICCSEFLTIETHFKFN